MVETYRLAWLNLASISTMACVILQSPRTSFRRRHKSVTKHCHGSRKVSLCWPLGSDTRMLHGVLSLSLAFESTVLHPDLPQRRWEPKPGVCPNPQGAELESYAQSGEICLGSF